MNVTDVSKYIGGVSGGVQWGTDKLSSFFTWAFSIRNLVFFGIIIAICYVCFLLYRQDVNRKKYYFNRRREI
jgi:hypothetical protein